MCSTGNIRQGLYVCLVCTQKVHWQTNFKEKIRQFCLVNKLHKMNDIKSTRLNSWKKWSLTSIPWWVKINNFPISCIGTTIIWEKPQLFVWITRVYVSTYRVYNWSRTIKQQYVYQKNFLISPRLRGKGNVKVVSYLFYYDDTRKLYHFISSEFKPFYTFI